METRLTKLEDNFNLQAISQARFEGKMDSLIEKINTLISKDLVTEADVEKIVTRIMLASQGACVKSFILEEDYSRLWMSEYAKQQTIKAKVLKGVFFGIGVIITTIVTVLTGIADLIK